MIWTDKPHEIYLCDEGFHKRSNKLVFCFFSKEELNLVWAYMDSIGSGADTEERSWEQSLMVLITGNFLSMKLSMDKIHLLSREKVMIKIVLDLI